MSDSKKPTLRTTRDMIRDVADCWRKQYWRDGLWGETITGDTEDVWKHLTALDVETATPADVAAIIGNKSWTALRCDECGRAVDAVIQFGDSDERRADVCPDCIRAAAEKVSPDNDKLASAHVALSEIRDSARMQGYSEFSEEIEARANKAIDALLK